MTHSKIIGIIIVLDMNSNIEALSSLLRKGSYLFIITVQPSPKMLAILKKTATAFRSDKDNIQFSILQSLFPIDLIIHIRYQTTEAANPRSVIIIICKISIAIVIGTPKHNRMRRTICFFYTITNQR